MSWLHDCILNVLDTVVLYLNTVKHLTVTDLLKSKNIMIEPVQ